MRMFNFEPREIRRKNLRIYTVSHLMQCVYQLGICRRHAQEMKAVRERIQQVTDFGEKTFGAEAFRRSVEAADNSDTLANFSSSLDAPSASRARNSSPSGTSKRFLATSLTTDLGFSTSGQVQDGEPLALETAVSSTREMQITSSTQQHQIAAGSAAASDHSDFINVVTQAGDVTTTTMAAAGVRATPPGPTARRRRGSKDGSKDEKRQAKRDAKREAKKKGVLASSLFGDSNDSLRDKRDDDGNASDDPGGQTDSSFMQGQPPSRRLSQVGELEGNANDNVETSIAYRDNLEGNNLSDNVHRRNMTLLAKNAASFTSTEGGSASSVGGDDLLDFLPYNNESGNPHFSHGEDSSSVGNHSISSDSLEEMNQNDGGLDGVDQNEVDQDRIDGGENHSVVRRNANEGTHNAANASDDDREQSEPVVSPTTAGNSGLTGITADIPNSRQSSKNSLGSSTSRRSKTADFTGSGGTDTSAALLPTGSPALVPAAEYPSNAQQNNPVTVSITPATPRIHRRGLPPNWVYNERDWALAWAVLRYRSSLARYESHATKMRTARTQSLKSFLLCIQALHTSTVYQTHDLLVGILGVCTAIFDMRVQWRASKG